MSLIFGQTARDAAIAVSMGAKGCALDNAVCEAFFATLTQELTRRRSWATRRELQTAVFAWIEGWYNRRRLHSTLGYLSPVDYENLLLCQAISARSGISADAWHERRSGADDGAVVAGTGDRQGIYVAMLVLRRLGRH